MMRQRKKEWGLILGLSLLLYGFGNLYQPTVVVGQSMAPTLSSGRLIWVDRLYYRNHRPQRGEVVVFRHDGSVYVKRVYRAPGEDLHYVGSGADFLGPVREQFADALQARYSRFQSSLRVKQMRVPEDCVFVLGDNFAASEDSRHLGPIPISEIIGRAHLDVDATKAMQYEYSPVPRKHIRQEVKHQTRTAPQLATRSGV